VGQLQAAFVAAWAESTGWLLTGDALFPDHREAPGTVAAGVLFASPTVGTSAADRFYALSLGGAQRSIYITNSYFVPSRSLRRMLLDAGHRGVDVRVLTAGRDIDVPLTWYAGRSHYRELLRAGVRIYELQGTMLHAKTMVVDGVWASVGAMNFDERSVHLNDEASLVLQDAGIGSRLSDLFQEDLRSSVEIDSLSFARRPASDRLLEAAARLLSPFL
jgi:cardiolipin synthase A/B